MAKWISLAVLLLIGAHIQAQTLDDAFTFNMSGVLATRMRMAMSAENVANLNTLKDDETGLPWQKRFLIVEPSEVGVTVTGIGKSDEPFGRYFDSAVPQADELGFTYHPNVNLPNEMVNIKYYEAMFEVNVNAFKISKQMYQTASDLMK